MLADKRVAEINATLKGSKVDKAQAYDKDVGELLGEVQRLKNENRLLNCDKDRLRDLERLEIAIASVGYTRGPTAGA